MTDDFAETEQQIAEALGGSAALAKALIDPFSYACGLRRGAVIYFEQAALHGEWVALRGVMGTNIWSDADRPPVFERGIEVRRDDIAWIADAPHGS